MDGVVDDLLDRALAMAALRLATQRPINLGHAAGRSRRRGNVADLVVTDDIARTHNHVRLPAVSQLVEWVFRARPPVLDLRQAPMEGAGRLVRATPEWTLISPLAKPGQRPDIHLT
jgi:hypothetical protein